MKSSSWCIVAAITVLCVLSFGYGVIVGRYHVFPFSVLSGVKRSISIKERERLRGRTVVDLQVLSGKRNMIAVAFGQSNAANHGETPHRSKRGVYNYYRGELYDAQDPMLGASGDKGSVWTRLGDRMVEKGLYDNVVFISIAEGGSEIRRWTPEGDLHRRLLDALETARGKGVVVTHLLWHQGETDAARGTAAEDYKRMFLEMVASIRRQGCNAPLYVAVASRGAGRLPVTKLRRAQRELVSVRDGIFPGPDTDTLGYAHRYDGTHFSEQGTERVAELWLQCLTNGCAGISNNALREDKP